MPRERAGNTTGRRARFVFFGDGLGIADRLCARFEIRFIGRARLDDGFFFFRGGI